MGKLCGFLADARQASQLSTQEARVEECMREWEAYAARASPETYLTDSVALRLESNLAGLFAPGHWLRDRGGRHLVSYYEAVGRADLALPLAAKNLSFIKETYP